MQEALNFFKQNKDKETFKRRNPKFETIDSNRFVNKINKLKDCQENIEHLELCREPSPIVVYDWLQTFKSMPKNVQSEALSNLVEFCSFDQVKQLKTLIAPHFKKDFITLLPKEVSLKIVSYLSPHDLIRAAQLSKVWRNLVEDSLLWMQKCRQYNITEIFPPNNGRLLNWQNCVAKNYETNSNLSCSLLEFTPISPNGLFLSNNNFYYPSNSSVNTEYSNLKPSTSQTLTPCSSIIKNRNSLNFSVYNSNFYNGKSCYDRSKWKAIYLRNRRIYNNWCKRRVNVACELRGHDEHVITCLQTCGDLIVTGSDDHTLRVWNAASAQCSNVLLGHVGGVWTLQLSNDGQIAVSGSTDRTVRVWNSTTGECIHTLNGHTSTVRCMSLKDDILVSGSRDCTVRVWNIRDGVCLQTLYGHLAAVRCVQFDGEIIISGGYDCNLIVWNVKTGEQIHVLEGHTNRVYSLLFESERDLVVSGSLDTTIRVWNVKTGKCIQTLIGHQSLTSGMQLQDNILISGNADSTIKIWNILSGQCSHTLAGPGRHSSAVTSLQIMENGLVVTGGDDGTVKLWDIKQGSFLCDLVKLRSGGSGGCVWRIKATPTMLICAVGSRNGTEDTKLILMDFDAPYP